MSNLVAKLLYRTLQRLFILCTLGFSACIDSTVSIDTYPSFGGASSIAMDTENIYIGGFQEAAHLTAGWRLEKRDKVSGELNPNFGDNGVLQWNLFFNPSIAYINDMVYENGYLYVVGFVYDRWELHKRSAVTGQLVASFGVNGIVVIPAIVNSLAGENILQMELEGNYLFIAYRNYLLEKRDKNTGVLDSNFANQGYLDTLYRMEGSPCFCIVNSNIYIGNHIWDEVTRTWDSRIESYQVVDGAPNNLFGVEGVMQTTRGASMLVCAANKIFYITTEANNVDNRDLELLVTKVDIASGGPDLSFGVGGSITINPSDLDDYFTTAAIFQNELYLGGTQYSALSGTSKDIWRVDKIAIDTGLHFPNFGTNGSIDSSDVRTDLSQLNGILYDNGVLFMTGVMTVSLDGQAHYWRLEKRDAATGSLITSFGNNGVIFLTR